MENSPQKKSFTVVLATGGTGGHLFPALALAEHVRQNGGEAIFITNPMPQSLNDRIKVYPHYVVSAGSSAKKGVWSPVTSLIKNGFGFLKAWKYLRKIKPDAVVGFGGFASAPTLGAALMRKNVIILHEQNAVLGRCNLMFFNGASGLALSFDDTARMPKKKKASKPKIVTIGNPVRDEFKGAAPYAVQEKSQKLHLLAVGGSLGAAAFAAYVPAAVKCLPEELRNRLRITQQARPEQCESLRKSYADLGIEANIESFFIGVGDLMKESDLIISRAGASSIAEISVVGRASILIPFPRSAHNHQKLNAEAMQKNEAALLLEEKKLTPEQLANALRDLLENDEKRVAFAKSARGLSKPNAGKALYDLTQSFIKSK